MIMTTRMPAERHSLTAAGTVGRNGSARPTRPRNSKGRPCGVAGRAASPGRAARATPSTRIPCPAMSSISRAISVRSAAGEPAERSNRLRGAFGRRRTTCRRLIPDIGHRQQLGAQAIFPFECQTAIRIVIGGENLGAERDRRPFPSDRTVRERWRECRARSSAELAIERRPAPGRQMAEPARSSTIVIRFCVSVPVLSVHSTVAAPSVSIARYPACQHTRPRNAPCAHDHKDRQHEREFFRQHRHAERDPAQAPHRANRRAGIRKAAPRAR